MRATQTQLFKILDGRKQYLIPIYQRTYSWTEKQCQQLWDDIVRVSDAQAWEQVDKDLSFTDIPAYFTMGNHDHSAYGKNLFKEKYGKTFYTFNKQNETFIILDTQKDFGRIPPDQLDFVKPLTAGEDPQVVERLDRAVA